MWELAQSRCRRENTCSSTKMTEETEVGERLRDSRGKAECGCLHIKLKARKAALKKAMNESTSAVP